MKKIYCVFLSALFTQFSLAQATETILYPASDNRVLDMHGNGFGDVSHAEDNNSPSLNVGDNADNQVWRSIIKFDLIAQTAALKSASSVTLRMTCRARNLTVPREWQFQVVAIPTSMASMIDIDPLGKSDDYSAKGTVLVTVPAGTIKAGEVFELNVTEAVKKQLSTGVFALRLQMTPATNNDSIGDQFAFYSGSHDVNNPMLRPQLVIE